MTLRTRQAFTLTLVVAGALLAALSVPAVWVNRTVMDTDRWVETVAPLAREPAIQAAVAETMSRVMLDAIDTQELVNQYVPEPVRPLAAPITSAVEAFVREQSVAFTRSELFSDAWAETNRVAHAAITAAITQRDGSVISNSGGTISISIGPIVDQLKQRLVESGLTFVMVVPTSQLETGIPIFSSPLLAKAARLIDTLQRPAFWFPALSLATFAGALAIAADKRRTLLWIGVGALVATVLPLQGLYLAKVPAVSWFESIGALNAAAADAAYDVVFRDLFAAERAVAFLAVLVIVGAVLAGPTRVAVAFREALSAGFYTTAVRFDFGAFGVFVARNKKALRGFGLLAAALIGAIVPAERVRSVGFIIAAVIALVGWLAAVEFVGCAGARCEISENESPPDRKDAR